MSKMTRVRAQCYYERVRRICLSPENLDNYKALFDLGYQSSDDLKAQYAAAFGDSYEYMVPELGALLAAVSNDTRDYSYERDICDDVSLFHGMTLDMARSPPRRRAAAHRTARCAPSRAGHRELRVCHPARRLLARGHRGHRDLYQAPAAGRPTSSTLHQSMPFYTPRTRRTGPSSGGCPTFGTTDPIPHTHECC